MNINEIIEESLELSPCCPVTAYSVILACSDYWPDHLSFREIWQNTRNVAAEAAADIRAQRRGENTDPQAAVQRLVRHLQSL